MNDIQSALEQLLPESVVLMHCYRLLSKAHFQIEDHENIILMEEELDLQVYSRSYISGRPEEMYLGNHFEAVVVLGAEWINGLLNAKYGLMRLYFDEMLALKGSDFVDPTNMIGSTI